MGYCTLRYPTTPQRAKTWFSYLTCQPNQQWRTTTVAWGYACLGKLGILKQAKEKFWRPKQALHQMFWNKNLATTNNNKSDINPRLNGQLLPDVLVAVLFVEGCGGLRMFLRFGQSFLIVPYQAVMPKNTFFITSQFDLVMFLLGLTYTTPSGFWQRPHSFRIAANTSFFWKSISREKKTMELFQLFNRSRGRI